MNGIHHKDATAKTSLLVGIGNSGRGDDGLGWAFVETIEKQGDFLGDTELRYQLQVEDADLIAQYEQVIFVDAFKGNLDQGFSFQPCLPAKQFAFTTHRLAPETVVYLCQELYQKFPEVYLLLINGDKWELEIGLSELGERNLRAALGFFEAEGVGLGN